jgi:hypothetical protein
MIFFAEWWEGKEGVEVEDPQLSRFLVDFHFLGNEDFWREFDDFSLF